MKLSETGEILFELTRPFQIEELLIADEQLVIVGKQFLTTEFSKCQSYQAFCEEAYPFDAITATVNHENGNIKWTKTFHADKSTSATSFIDFDGYIYTFIQITVKKSQLSSF